MDRNLTRSIAALVLSSSGAMAACNFVPPPDTPLRADGFYADARGSEIDPTRKAARDRETAIYEAVVRRVQASADAFALRGDAQAGRCALEQLDTWARMQPLAGRLATRQANYERNWYLAGFALAYLKLRGSGAAETRSRVENWFAAMAAGSEAALDAGEVPGNNLLYWSGLALGAAGLATGNPQFDRRARAILDQGLASVGRTGMLPLELRRGRKALDYHAFAAAPLSLLALIAQARESPFDSAALARLGEAVLAGLADPRPFGAAAGDAQEMPPAWNLAWLPVYRSLVPGGALPAYSPASHFLGGDVAATTEAIRAVVPR